MRFTTVVLLTLCASSGAQPYEFDIPLPDSLGGLGSPSIAVYAPAVGRVYVGGGRSSILAIDGATSQKVRRIPSTFGGAMHYNPVNNRLYSGNSTVTAVNCSTDLIVDTIALGSHYRNARSVLNQLTNRLYYLGGENEQPIAVIDCHGDSVLRTIPVPGQPNAIAVSTVSNKIYVSAVYPRRLIVIDGVTDTIRGYVASPCGELCYNPLMNRLYNVEYGLAMSVVDCGTDQVIDSIGLRSGDFMAWCPVGNKLYCSISGRDTVCVVNCSTNTIVRRLPMPDDPRFLTYDSISNTMYVSCYGGNKVAVIDCSSDSVVAVSSVPRGPSQGCSSLQGGRVYVPSESGYAVTAFDATTHSVVATVPTGERIGKALYAGGEGKLYCFETDSGWLAVCDTGTRKVTRRLRMSPGFGSMLYDRSQQKLFCAGDSGLAVVGTASDSLLVTYEDWGAWGICLDPTSERAFVSTSDSTIRVFDASSDMFVDSIALPKAAAVCYDPLTNRLWCQTPSSMAVFDCDSGLRRIGTTALLVGPTWNPWDGLIYGLDTAGIWGYDPVTLARTAGTRFHMPYPSGIAFNAAGNRCYFWENNGSTGQEVGMFNCRSRSLTWGMTLGYPTYIDFAAAGRRVWGMSAYESPKWQNEILQDGGVCSVVGVTTSPLTCDAVLGRTFVPDLSASRIAVFRDAMQDSLDVACTRVVGPLVRPDTGDAVVFRTALVNCGSEEKSSTVRLRVYLTDRPGDRLLADDLQDSAAIMLAGCSYSAAAFDTWRPTARGLYQVEAVSEWADDENRSNDTARCLFRVGTPCIDVSPLRVVAPTGTVDSGTSVIPKSWILNRGAVTVSCRARMAIGSQYEDVKPTGAIAPGDSQLVSFASWAASELGVLSVRCSTMLDNDSVPQNDLLLGTVQVQQPGGIEAIDSIPASFFAADWIPNPVRSAASLRYGLPSAADVRLTIFSVDGRQIRVLVNGLKPAGYHCAMWDGRDDIRRSCAPGVYFCRADVGPLRRSYKLTVAR